jgi:hypothetical protein
MAIIRRCARGCYACISYLNLSTQQIAAELNLHPDDAYNMAAHLRTGIEIKKPVTLR